MHSTLVKASSVQSFSHMCGSIHPSFCQHHGPSQLNAAPPCGSTKLFAASLLQKRRLLNDFNN
jgi:hypothetical protein